MAYFDLDTFSGKGGIPHEGIDQRYDGLGAAAVDVVVGQMGAAGIRGAYEP